MNCIYCGKEVKTQKGKKIHELYCIKNPKRRIHPVPIITWSEEQKEKQRRKLKSYFQNNPDKVPYVKYHSSNLSYPEKYFLTLFQIEGINLDFHKRVGTYELDFSNEFYKLDLEIDGEQHYVDSKIINHDKRRNEYLEGLGWNVVRIRWAFYKLLSYEEKKEVIINIKKILNLDESIKSKDLDDSLDSIIKDINIRRRTIHYCLDCGREIGDSSIRCKECEYKNRRKKELSRELIIKELFNLKTMIKVANKYKISTTLLKKWCNKLNIKNCTNKYIQEEYFKLYPELEEKKIDKKRKKVIQLDLEKNYLREFNSLKEAEDYLTKYFNKKCDEANISNACYNKQKAYGYYWQFK